MTENNGQLSVIEPQVIKGPQDLFPTHESKAKAVVEDAKALIVADAESYALAGEFVKSKSAEKKQKVDGDIQQYVDAENARHKAATTFRNRVESLYKEAIAIATGKRLTYEAAEREKAEAERRRIEAEERRRRDEEAAQAAAALEKEGRKEEAEAVIEQAISAPVFVPPAAPPAKTDGLSVRTTWKCEVNVGFAVPAAYCKMVPDDAKINALAKEIGEKRAASVAWLRVWPQTKEYNSGR